jgi:hypothetical protein
LSTIFINISRGFRATLKEADMCGLPLDKYVEARQISAIQEKEIKEERPTEKGANSGRVVRAECHRASFQTDAKKSRDKRRFDRNVCEQLDENTI